MIHIYNLSGESASSTKLACVKNTIKVFKIQQQVKWERSTSTVDAGGTPLISSRLGERELAISLPTKAPKEAAYHKNIEHNVTYTFRKRSVRILTASTIENKDQVKWWTCAAFKWTNSSTTHCSLQDNYKVKKYALREKMCARLEREYKIYFLHMRENTSKHVSTSVPWPRRMKHCAWNEPGTSWGAHKDTKRILVKSIGVGLRIHCRDFSLREHHWGQ